MQGPTAEPGTPTAYSTECERPACADLCAYAFSLPSSPGAHVSSASSIYTV